MHIDHINIRAPLPQLEQVRDFYCAIFDLRVGNRPAFSRAGFWLYADDDPLIHLNESDEPFLTGGPFHLDHIAFQLSGLHRLLEKLTSLSIPFSSNPLHAINATQVFFKDPVGTGIEVKCVGEFI